MAGKGLMEATLVAVVYSTMDVQLWRLKNIQTDPASSEGSSPAFQIKPNSSFSGVFGKQEAVRRLAPLLIRTLILSD